MVQEKKYYNKYLGYNSSLVELQIHFLSIMLPNLDNKWQFVKLYKDKLSVKVIKPIEIEHGYQCLSYLQYLHRKTRKIKTIFI